MALILADPATSSRRLTSTMRAIRRAWYYWPLFAFAKTETLVRPVLGSLQRTMVTGARIKVAFTDDTDDDDTPANGRTQCRCACRTSPTTARSRGGSSRSVAPASPSSSRSTAPPPDRGAGQSLTARTKLPSFGVWTKTQQLRRSSSHNWRHGQARPAVPSCGARPARLRAARARDRAAGARALRARAERGRGLALRDGPPARGRPGAAANFRMLERLVKLALWARGGFRIHLDAPAALVERLRAHFRDTPDRPLRLRASSASASTATRSRWWRRRSCRPSARRRPTLGGHLDGCRIGFDLGGSDRKVAAVIDGRVVWSEETEWDPYHQPDPQYHWDGIMDSLRRAAEHLPRVDAIGGSAAGVYVDNQVKFSSLFRGVAPELFERRVQEHLPRPQARLARRPLRRGQRRRRHRAARIDVAATTAACSGSRSAPAPRAATSPPTGASRRGSTRSPSCPSTTAPTRRATSGRATVGCCVQYLSQQAVGRLLAPGGHRPVRRRCRCPRSSRRCRR